MFACTLRRGGPFPLASSFHPSSPWGAGAAAGKEARRLSTLEENGCLGEDGADSNFVILVPILTMPGSTQSSPRTAQPLPGLVGSLRPDEKGWEIREMGRKQVSPDIICPQLTSCPGTPAQPGAGLLVPTAGLPTVQRLYLPHHCPGPSALR